MRHIKGILVALTAIALPFLIGYAIIWADNYYGFSGLRGIIAMAAMIVAEVPIYILARKRRVYVIFMIVSMFVVIAVICGQISQMQRKGTAPVVKTTLYEEEIQFQDLKWGMNINLVNSRHPEYKITDLLSGGYMETYPIEEIVTGHTTKEFEYTDINVFDHIDNRHIRVAGYTTDDVMLFFAYTPIGDRLPRNSLCSALYAVRYEFSPNGIDEMSVDLRNKLKALYGDVDESGSYDAMFDKRDWAIWYGQNRTAVALTTRRAKDKNLSSDLIWVTYYTGYGDEWLQEASDTIKNIMLKDEREAQESGDTAGL